MALLDWLLETTTGCSCQRGDRAAFLLRSTGCSPCFNKRWIGCRREPRRILLFFDFWARGIRNAQIRRKMRRELARYRDAFRPMAAEVLHAEPNRFGSVTPEGLSGVAVSFIKGCAVQSMIDSRNFDLSQYLAATRALIGQLAREARTSTRTRMGN